jgi:putative peptide zinc metalloprotease protein
MLHSNAVATSGGATEASAEPSAPEVPERPALAPNVQPVGEMPGTGFTDQQWLILRNGQFLQVSQLLYQVAAQIDGVRTLSDIAERLTETTEWAVTEDNVRQIIASKLIPLGLIAQPGDAASQDAPMPSPLGVNMRMKVIRPQFLNPVTLVLKDLFAPIRLALVLSVVVLAHWWLFVRHGITAGVVDVLYHPWLFLPILALILAAAVFHEFGHASALRYGGGQVRGMGIGFYLIYPAFYTDVTDSYRLGKAARVRTDLGGVYFHLIFTLAVIGLYFLTGWEFLLLTVVLIDLEIARQFIPFVRLDGYWVLADLTGIPDFFSQILPFIASIIPIPGYKGSKLPSLKPWVRCIFALFILLVVPALIVLMFFMLSSVPNLIATTWDALLAEVADFTKAQSQGDFLAMALSVVETLLLALPIIGTVYILVIIILMPLKALWNWSKPALLRRALAAIVTVALVAGIAALWTPRLIALTDAGPMGVQAFDITERAHVDTKVNYPQSPPVGGNHAQIWQNCGFYADAVPSENVVHSMEHGAVWITYRSDLAEEQIESLRTLARSQDHLLVSSYPGLRSPVVVSAWGRQLELPSAKDPRLQRFIATFRLGKQAPESGGPCTAGQGEPK